MSIDARLEEEFKRFKVNNPSLEFLPQIPINNNLNDKIQFLEERVNTISGLVTSTAQIGKKKFTRNLLIILALNLWDEILTFFGILYYFSKAS